MLMVVIWAINFSVLKVALRDLTPFGVNALRFPLASAALYLLLRTRGPVRLPALAECGRILWLGLLGNVIYQGFFIEGLSRTRAGNAALLLAATPVVTALLSAARGHERVGGRVWLGVIATVAGIALVIVGGTEALAIDGETLRGDLLMLAASGSWALYTVGARDPIARHGSITVTAWTIWAGTPFLLMLGWQDISTLDWSAVSPLTWASVAYAGLLGIGLAYLMWYNGVGRIGNTRTATYLNLVPVLALVVAWMWIGEVPTAWQLVGATVIIGGVTVARSR